MSIPHPDSIEAIHPVASMFAPLGNQLITDGVHYQ
jgi:hypothetical protein